MVWTTFGSRSVKTLFLRVCRKLLSSRKETSLCFCIHFPQQRESTTYLLMEGGEGENEGTR